MRMSLFICQTSSITKLLSTNGISSIDGNLRKVNGQHLELFASCLEIYPCQLIISCGSLYQASLMRPSRSLLFPSPPTCLLSSIISLFFILIISITVSAITFNLCTKSKFITPFGIQVWQQGHSKLVSTLVLLRSIQTESAHLWQTMWSQGQNRSGQKSQVNYRWQQSQQKSVRRSRSIIFCQGNNGYDGLRLLRTCLPLRSCIRNIQFYQMKKKTKTVIDHTHEVMPWNFQYKIWDL